MLNIPISLYVHFPWCIRKCPYCDFNSYPLKDKNLPAEYSVKLIHELTSNVALVGERPLVSIYFGGGTPSLLPIAAIKSVLDVARQNFAWVNDIEITLEVNPGTINLDYLCGLREIGINRLSLGVQSFTAAKLAALGRIHNIEQAHEAINLVKQADFNNFNIDLMFGLPEQTIAEAQHDFEQALRYVPPHLSWYQLTLESNTIFAKSPPPLPSDDELWSIQEAGQKAIADRGLNHYEVSAYCKAGYECRHNVNYWEFGDYLGIGAGAHSKITFPNHVVERFWQEANPQKYLRSKNGVSAGKKVISLKELPFEFMLNALRLFRPVSYELFCERVGVPVTVINDELTQAETQGLIEIDDRALCVTERGKNFLNNLLELFL